MNDSITIFIPTFNRASQIEKKLNFIIKNNLNDRYRFYVVNDGSTDATKKTLEKFKDKNIIIENNEKNLGYTRNIVKSFKNIQTKYVIFMTDDEHYEFKNFIKIEKLLSRQEFDFISCKWDSKSSSRNNFFNRRINLYGIWKAAKHASGLIYRVNAISIFFDRLIDDLNNKSLTAYFFPHIYLLFHLSLSNGFLYQSNIKIGASIESELMPTNIKDENGDSYISFYNSIERHRSFSKFYEDLYHIYRNKNILTIHELHSYTLSNNFLLGMSNDFSDLYQPYLVSSALSSLKPRRLVLSIGKYSYLRLRIYCRKLFKLS